VRLLGKRLIALSLLALLVSVIAIGVPVTRIGAQLVSQTTMGLIGVLGVLGLIVGLRLLGVKDDLAESPTVREAKLEHEQAVAEVNRLDREIEQAENERERLRKEQALADEEVRQAKDELAELRRAEASDVDRPHNGPRIAVADGGDTLVEVVGEAQHQAALERIAGGKHPGGTKLAIRARLVPEPSNPYDPDAIRVEIDHAHVGYLSRPAALAFQPVAARLTELGLALDVSGRLKGGWLRDDGDEGDFGVTLTMGTPDELLKGLDRAT